MKMNVPVPLAVLFVAVAFLLLGCGGYGGGGTKPTPGGGTTTTSGGGGY
jgi:hypothetical protein